MLKGLIFVYKYLFISNIYSYHIVPLKETIPSIKSSRCNFDKAMCDPGCPDHVCQQTNVSISDACCPSADCDLIFGNNHLIKTDAVINHSKRSISFTREEMSFEVNCTLLTDSNSNRLHALHRT